MTERPHPTNLTWATEVQQSDGTWTRINGSSRHDLAEQMGHDSVALGEATAYRIIEVPDTSPPAPSFARARKTQLYYTPGNPRRRPNRQ